MWGRSPQGHRGAAAGKGVAIPYFLAFYGLAWRMPFQAACSLSRLVACEVDWCPLFYRRNVLETPHGHLPQVTKW